MVLLLSKVILLFALTPCYMGFFLSSSSSSSSNGKGNFPYTHNKQQLNTLFNRPVQSLREYKRPLTPFGYNIGTTGEVLSRIGINHRGQVATMADGEKYLVHKGPGFGKNSQTVVVDAKYMSKEWSPNGEIQHSDPARQSTRLGDLIRTGGKKYNVMCNNCIHASDRMGDRFNNGR